MEKLTQRLLCLFLSLAFIVPLSAAHAEPEKKTVRVGWYESAFNTTDASGRRSGYAYEYQLKIAAYTGWTYEYVNASWADLMRMLETGEIDLMSDISYTPEREERMLFSALPMGTEDYCLFISPNNRDITLADASSLNGKRVAVSKGSIQTGFFKEWERQQGIETDLIEVTYPEDVTLQMVETGELDGYVTVDTFVDPKRAAPLCRIGSSDFYFAVTNSRPDLQAELNDAMNRIRDENRYYNVQMYEKYIKRAGANVFLTKEEVEWLAGHGTIRLGYQDNYLAFCAADNETGELTGAIRDYLAYASDCLANAHLDFEAKAYPTAAAAMDALEKAK